MGQSGQRPLTATEKKYGGLVGTKHLGFCSGYTAPTPFRNLQKSSLEWKEHDTPSTLPTMAHRHAFHIKTRYPPMERTQPIRHKGTR